MTNGSISTNGTNGNVTQSCDVCIVGAGPVGTYLAVRLARSGLKVIVFESLQKLADEPRAVSHMPILFKEFEKAGILERMKEVSKVHGGAISYRRTKDQKIIERIQPVPNRPGPLAVPQRVFTQLLMDKLKESSNGELLFGQKVVGIEEADEGLSLDIEDMKTNQRQHFRCKYLIGADGAKSMVRKAMGTSYEGVTLPYKLIAADVVFPFEKYGFDGANFMCDPEDFGMIALTAKTEDEQTLWRVSLGFAGDTSDDEVMKMLPQKFQRLFEDMKPGQYEVLKAQPYPANQFCTPVMKRERMMLIGDSAHLCNPYSGQLMACGIFDSSSLAQCLVSVLQQGAPESLLDEWAQDRVSKFQNVLDPLSQKCFAAVRDPDTESIGERHPFLKAMKAGPNAKGPMPTLHTDVTQLKSWHSHPDADHDNSNSIELIWSKA